MGPPGFDIDLPPPGWSRRRDGSECDTATTGSPISRDALLLVWYGPHKLPNLLSAAGCCPNRSPEPIGFWDECAR